MTKTAITNGDSSLTKVQVLPDPGKTIITVKDGEAVSTAITVNSSTVAVQNKE